MAQAGGQGRTTARSSGNTNAVHILPASWLPEDEVAAAACAALHTSILIMFKRAGERIQPKGTELGECLLWCLQRLDRAL